MMYIGTQMRLVVTISISTRKDVWKQTIQRALRNCVDIY